MITNRQSGGFTLILPEEKRERYRGRLAATYCVFTQAELAKEIGCTDRTARRCIRDLQDAGLIDVHRRGMMGASCFTIPAAVCDYMPRERLKERLFKDI